MKSNRAAPSTFPGFSFPCLHDHRDLLLWHDPDAGVPELLWYESVPALATAQQGLRQMAWESLSQPVTTDRGTRVALIFALVAERLSIYYEHAQWPTEAQGASLAADWLARSKRNLPLADRKHLSVLSNQLARQIAESLSREAGLYTAHEMMESLDPNYPSELAGSLMAECERVLDAGLAA